MGKRNHRLAHSWLPPKRGRERIIVRRTDPHDLMSGDRDDKVSLPPVHDVAKPLAGRPPASEGRPTPFDGFVPQYELAVNSHQI